MTPEGKIKERVKRMLAKFKFDPTTNEPVMDEWWPVPNGLGASHLDCIVCFYGRYIAIETKAPGKKPTPRQETRIKSVASAGGCVLVIDGDEGLAVLYTVLVDTASCYGLKKKPDDVPSNSVRET